MRADDIARRAALASVVGFVVGLVAFLLGDPGCYPAVGASFDQCRGANEHWEFVSALGMLVFFLGAPTAAGSWLYARLAAGP